MAFADHIEESGLSLRFYVRIEGLPWVLANFPLPDAWNSSGYVSIDSESYVWENRLLLDEQVEVEILAEPWAGVGTVGDLEIRFQLTGSQNTAAEISADAMLQLVTSTPKRGTSAVQTANLTPTATTLTVDDTTGWTSTGRVFHGHETSTYSGTTGTSFTGLTRARYGSMARASYADHSEVADTGDGGCYVADHSLVLNGRIIRLYVCPGDEVDGSFVPRGATCCSSDDYEAFCGIIQGWNPAQDWTSVSLRAQELTRLLDEPIASRLPWAKGGCHGNLWVGDDNGYIEFTWCENNPDATPTPIYRSRHVRSQLVATVGSPPTYVSEGFYSWAEVSTLIANTFAQYDSDSPNPTAMSYWVTIQAQEDGTSLALFRASTDATASGGNTYTTTTLTLHVAGETDRRPCILREMGFTEPMTIEVENVGSMYQWIAEAHRGMPRLRLPANTIGRKLAYVYTEGVGFDTEPGWQDADGEDIDGYVLVDEEILWFDTKSTVTTTGGGLVRFLGPVRRAQFGTKAVEHYHEYNRTNTDFCKITQVMAFPNTGLGKVSLYCLLGGSGTKGSNGTYDQGWRGSGAYIDQRLVDTASFLALDEQTDSRRDHVITNRTTWRDFFASDFVSVQGYVVPQDDSTNGFRLSAARVPMPMEAAAAVSTLLLDHSCVRTSAGVGWEASEDRLVNTINAKDVNWNPGTGKGDETITHRNATSTGTFGEAEPVEISMKGTIGREAALDRVVSLAQNLYALFSLPFVVIEVPVTRASKIWTVNLGDTLTVTHTVLPSGSTVAYGITTLACTVIGKVSRYRDLSEDATRGTLTLLATGHQGWRNSWWAPCARVTSITNDGAGHVRFVVDDEYYCREDEGWDDDDYFAASYEINVYQPGSESTAETHTVLSVDTTNHYIDSTAGSTSLTAPCVIEFSVYSSSRYHDDQYHYAHMSDDDGKLDTSSSTDEAYQWS